MTLWNDLEVDSSQKDLRPKEPDEPPNGTVSQRTIDTIHKVLPHFKTEGVVSHSGTVVGDMLSAINTQQELYMVACLVVRKATDVLSDSKEAPKSAITLLAQVLRECARELDESVAKRNDK